MTIAKMIAVCIVHGGVGPCFFSDRLFMQLCGTCSFPVSLEEIADSCFREKLTKVVKLFERVSHVIHSYFICKHVSQLQQRPVTHSRHAPSIRVFKAEAEIREIKEKCLLFLNYDYF